jgi:D-lactate dehydrogenase (cytochrome)
MTRVVAVRPEDLQVDVEPGVVYATLNRALRSHGLFFPPSPGGSADWATVGGMVANNASGIYSVKYGGTRDHVRAATIVTGTGEVLRLGNRARKSASGYHLLGAS